MTCFKDLVFRVSQNESLEPCAEQGAFDAVIAIYAVMSALLAFALIQCLVGALLQTNPKAKTTLFAFSVPTLFALLLSLLICAGGPMVHTGEHGIVLVVVFGLCLSGEMVVLQFIGLASLERLAEISLQSVDSKTRAKYIPSPLLMQVKRVLAKTVYLWTACIFLCLCILFPVSQVGPKNALFEGGTKQLWWDLGVILAQFGGGTNILLFCVVSMYTIAQNLEVCLQHMDSLELHDRSEKSKQYRARLRAMIFRIKVAMWSCAPAGVSNWTMAASMTYFSTVEPRFYLIWIFLFTSLVFAQYYANAMFCPPDMTKQLVDMLMCRRKNDKAVENQQGGVKSNAMVSSNRTIESNAVVVASQV